MNNERPRNADRAEWAASAMSKFATLAGLDNDLHVDPETVLADLLADLMHWCDAQKANYHLEEAVDFQSALGRAQRHYDEEFGDGELERLEDPHAQ